MTSKTTHRASPHKRMFANALIVTFSLLAGATVLVAAVLVGQPIFNSLLARLSG